MKRFSSLFDNYAALLDITREEQENAIREYEALGNWLIENLKGRADANIYPQGSFRLGTVVKPADGGGDFDIDLVFWRNLARSSISQEELKATAGELLTAYCKERGFSEPIELGRCWRLEFFELGFHMDVLPVIPDPEIITGVLLTDKELRNWLYSNPIGYANWFEERMEESLIQEDLIALAKRLGRSVEEVPRHFARTPLQRVVQLLKRSRDEFFASTPEQAPASILITTLAARAYAFQRDLQTALFQTVEAMPATIEKRPDGWWVENPAHRQENFADKWNTYPDRRDAFFAWLNALRESLSSSVEAVTLSAAAEELTSVLGSASVEAARDLSGKGRSSEFEAARGRGRALREQMIEEKFPVHLTDSVKISCEVAEPGYANRFTRRRAQHRRRLKKSRPLRFQIVDTSVQEPFDVYWKVRNFGREAQVRGGLRGEIVLGGRIHPERTLYRGDHYIDCYIVKNGQCVARDREWVPIGASS